MTTATKPESALSPLGKAGEEVTGVAIIVGVIGLAILAPGLFGLWLPGEGPIVLVIVRAGAFISLVGISAFLGTLLMLLGVGILEYLSFHSYPALLRSGAHLISAGVACWHGEFGILVALSATSVLWREWTWKRRAANTKR